MSNARYALIEGAGHNLWLTHAAELRSLLRDFLTGLKSGGFGDSR
ncbi:MAG: alpha/beta fold hydrolase [Thermomicrobiales bacterium]